MAITLGRYFESHESARKALRCFFVIVLVALGFILPNLRPSGHSFLIWMQNQFWRVMQEPDPWRLTYEEVSPKSVRTATKQVTVTQVPAIAHSAPGNSLAKACREVDDPLVTIPRRQLFELMEPCIVVRGKIVSKPVPDPDGLAFNFEVDPSQSHLFEDPKKVVAIIVPSDAPGCSPGKPVDTGHQSKVSVTCSGANVTVPAPGTEVEIVGAYVFSRDLKAPVIAPVWAIQPASPSKG